MFVITVVFQVKKESIEDFRKAVMQQARNSLEKEEACHRFDVCFSDARSDCGFLFEVNEDQAAFDKHRETEHFRNFREIAPPMLDGQAVEGWGLQSLD